MKTAMTYLLAGVVFILYSIWLKRRETKQIRCFKLALASSLATMNQPK